MARSYTYSDLDLNFLIHPVKKDINRLLDDDAIIASVRNLVLTNKFEVPFAPEQGSNIRRILFENWSPALDALLSQLIAEVINNYEPRVTLQSIKVDFDESENGYHITIFFLNNLIPNKIFNGTFFLEKSR
jgi:phage baseplate assembly protein W